MSDVRSRLCAACGSAPGQVAVLGIALSCLESVGEGWQPEGVFTMASMREANAESEDVLEAVGRLESNASARELIGGGAAPLFAMERALVEVCPACMPALETWEGEVLA